ncbi:late endosomal/lysosomal adaptor, MAPK and MTOR activator 1 isoform X1 [Anticarsia gemmatalis]|uniref:late endosomal/lysosomal adaptor, MAPK and MTOR activator 1 isoform X1 n=1 Tax=Anticarsia gemmatalis TaxID=129554 RepID=UPI003F75ABD1
MSVFDGEIDFQSVTMVDFCKKVKPKSPRRKAVDDDCLIVGLSRDALRPREQPRRFPDRLCPLSHEYYKEAVKRFANDYPKLTKKYMSGDIDPTPIEHEIQDLKRTEYLTKYCSRELPFMSVNLARRARALQTLRLPDDVYIPDTSQRGSYRAPKPEKYAEPPSAMSMRPKFDNALGTELRRILRVSTGDTTYNTCHGLLAKVVLEENPFGKPRKEPRYGRWKNPYYFTYRIN